MNTLNKNKRVSFLLISIFLFTLVFAAFPVYAGAESTGQWQLIKTPVSGTVKTNDYMVEYSANIVTYHSYHAYGNMKVVKGTLLSQLPQTIQAGEKLNLNTSAEIVSIQEGIDQGTFSGVLTAQGGITHGKVYSIVNDNGVYFPKTNSLEVIAEKGDPSKTSEGHYIRVRFDCNGYDASQLDNWYVYEWVEGASATPAPTTVSGASGWQLIKTPVSGTVTTNDYMVEY
ncbi:MAG: hypothetical protein HGA22_11420, partial [Clostridiales bacterium]|nr:hypothetical protein [Clostridiales bacterium]